MRFVSVDKERFEDIMERAGAYLGNTEHGFYHRKELWVRDLSVWQGETVVGVCVSDDLRGNTYTYTVAGYLDDYYK